MAGFFQQVLQSATNELFGRQFLRDYKHAAKTFLTDGYAYSPKFKWLFHVYFDINDQFVNQASIFPSDKNFGLAVKSVDLPKYSFDLHDMNQYNRHRMIQTKIKYDPVTVVFNDDNNNLVRKLWYAYYSYNVNDPNNINNQAANNANQYSNNLGDEQWGYSGAELNPTPLTSQLATGKVPFFRNINIYGFNQHNFALYQLVNPIIDNWQHDTYDYYQTSGIMENRMSIRYEYVKYYDGALSGSSPGNFVQQFGNASHYDVEPSPISKPGTRNSILGQGGLIDTATGLQQDLSDGNYIGAAIKGITAAKNLNKKGLVAAAKTELTQGLAQTITNNASNFRFPAFKPSNNPTTSTPPPTTDIGGG